jgi:ABC-type molybdate transport system permease subunit
MPLAIYEAAMTGDDRTALALSLALTLISVLVMIASGRLGRNER